MFTTLNTWRNNDATIQKITQHHFNAFNDSLYRNSMVLKKTTQSFDAIKAALLKVKGDMVAYETLETPSYFIIKSNASKARGVAIATTPVSDKYSIKSIKLNKNSNEITLWITPTNPHNKNIFEILNKDSISLFNQTYNDLQVEKEQVRSVVKKQKNQNDRQNRQAIEGALSKIITNPTGYKISKGAGTTISKDEKMKGTEYFNDSNISYIRCTFSHGITLRTETKSITTSYQWISELDELFDDARQTVRERNREIAQIEAKKKQEQAIAEQQALERYMDAKKVAKKEKLERLNKACVKAGYNGYCEAIIPNIITTTQETGGLEEFLNLVVDYPTGELYSEIKAISILNNAVLYSYSGPDTHFVIHVEKKPGKIYQEGQSLEKNFYVFMGMYSYTSTSGAKKSVPSFKLANIEM